MFLCYREQFIAAGIVPFVPENGFPFQQSRRKKRDILYISALSLLSQKSPHSSRLQTRLTSSGIVCFLRKLLWKLALLERTKRVVRETTVILYVSHYFLLGNWVVQGKLG